MGDDRALEESLGEAISDDDDWGEGDSFGDYHPSEVTGCPLKVVLDKMTENETVLNCYLFQGTAVHYYLQESGIMDEALHNAGYHMLDAEYEVRTRKEVGDGVYLTGQCDVICSDGDNQTIFDIKYSSVGIDSGSERLFKYFSQANCYAFMFDVDEYGLIMLDSREGDDIINQGIGVETNERHEDNWEIVKKKTRAIHKALQESGYAPEEGEGVVWPVDQLELQDTEFWDELTSYFDDSWMPAYDRECRYCDHKEYCGVKNGDVSSGLTSFKGG